MDGLSVRATLDPELSARIQPITARTIAADQDDDALRRLRGRGDERNSMIDKQSYLTSSTYIKNIDRY